MRTHSRFILAMLPLAVVAGAQANPAGNAVKRDETRGTQASTSVSLSTYVMQSAAFMKPGNAAEGEVQQCVAKLTDVAPGGGDAFTQQRSVSSELPLAQIMIRGLEAAKNDSSAAGQCAWLMSNLPIKTQDPAGEIYVNRSGQAIDPAFKAGASDQAGRRMVCAAALAEVSKGVLEELKASPMSSEAQAVEVARQHIGRELRAAATRAYHQDKEALAVPVIMATGNLGATKPYAPVSHGGMIVTKPVTNDSQDAVQYVGDRVSTLAQQTMDISAIALGGFMAWTTKPTAAGLVSKYDGATFSVTKNGLPFFDASTVGGASTKVAVAANGSFTSATPQLSGRGEQLRELSTCALAMNNIAQQLAPKILKPKMVPPPSSKAMQALLRKADFGKAFTAARELTSGNLQTDFSDGGMRWRIGAFGFAKNGGAARAGVQVTLGGAIWFDGDHIAGQGYTINASAGESTSASYASIFGD